MSFQSCFISDNSSNYLEIKWNSLQLFLRFTFLYEILKVVIFAPSFLSSTSQVSFWPTFYTQLFYAKVLLEAFMCLQFRFELFLVQEYWPKCAHNIMVKLTPGLHLWFFWGGRGLNCHDLFETRKIFLKKIIFISWFRSIILHNY